MDNPVEEISQVIRHLCQTPPSTQRAAIETYFTPDAAFYHPFCRVDRFFSSRMLIMAIYRWYKIMSPKIDMEIRSIAFDQPNALLYVSMTQVFSIWAIPLHATRAHLTTVLQLERNPRDKKYYIASQNDLYQTTEFVRFVLPFVGYWVVFLWQVLATVACLLGTVVFAPVTWVEEAWGAREKERLKRMN